MKTKVLTFPLRLSIIILIFGALFKIMHWPFANNLMLIGAVLLAILYTIRFISKPKKFLLDYVKLALVLVWVFNYLVGAFHIFYVPYFFQILLFILFIYWFIVEGPAYIKNRKFTKNRFLKVCYKILIALTAFMVFFGLLFKVQHWPYGSILFVLGILSLNILLFLDYFLIDRSQLEKE